MFEKKSETNKILLTGGGTGGSVSPLLAIVEELVCQPERSKESGDFLCAKDGGTKGSYDFLWIGTKSGVEKEMVASASSILKKEIAYRAISNGKLRRYFSLRNFIDPIFIAFGFLQSLFIILSWQPRIVITAGSFVSVPVVWAAWLLRIPVLVHQMDVRPGLANKLMAPFARIITVTFEKSLADYGKKAIWTGNPVRKKFQFSILNIKTNKIFDLRKDLPVLLVLGGGTGAQAINKLVWESLNELTKFCQIIHQTGKEKGDRQGEESIPVELHGNLKTAIVPSARNDYQPFEFLNIEEMAAAYQAADLVISRAGMGVLTELSYLGKASILIPMPKTHQEDNAEVFKKEEAALILTQTELTKRRFIEKIKELFEDDNLKRKYSERIKSVIKTTGEFEKIIHNLLK